MNLHLTGQSVQEGYNNCMSASWSAMILFFHSQPILGGYNVYWPISLQWRSLVPANRFNMGTISKFPAIPCLMKTIYVSLSPQPVSLSWGCSIMASWCAMAICVCWLVGCKWTFIAQDNQSVMVTQNPSQLVVTEISPVGQSVCNNTIGDQPVCMTPWF